MRTAFEPTQPIGWLSVAMRVRWGFAMDIVKWNWMMDYCIKNKWPPSNSYFWRKAEYAYFKQSATLC